MWYQPHHPFKSGYLPYHECALRSQSSHPRQPGYVLFPVHPRTDRHATAVAGQKRHHGAENGTPHAVSGGLRIICLYRPRHVDDCRILPGSLLYENHLAGYRLRGTGSRNLPGSHSRCDDDQRRIYHTICHPTLQEKLRQHQNLLRRDPGSLRHPVFMGAVWTHRGSERGDRDCRPDYRPVRPTDYAPPGLRPSLAGRTGYPCYFICCRTSTLSAGHYHFPRIRQRRSSNR